MRCYNGCPDDDLQAFLDDIAVAKKKMVLLDPSARCVYFPMEQRYSVWSDLTQITHEHPSSLLAINEAIRRLEQRVDEL